MATQGELYAIRLSRSRPAERDPGPEQVTPASPGELEGFQNPSKVLRHLDRLAELKQTGDTRPVHMTIGLTNYCNHRCPWCYINWNQAGSTSERSGAGDASRKAVNADDRLIAAIGEAVALGLKAVTIVGDGEPTLHKSFIPYLERLAAMGLDIGIFSNLSTQRADVIEAMARHCFFVRGSIDAASAEVHQQSHGTDDFERVLANLRRLVELRGERRRPAIGVQFVTNQWNYWQLPEAARLYRDIGVDYLTIKPAYKNVLNPSHPENEVDLELAFAKMKEAKSLETARFRVFAKFPQFAAVVGQTTNDGRHYKKCQATPFSPYLDEDGNVEMCGNLKGRGFTMGNINESSFTEIWSSARRRDCLDRIDLHQCPSGCKLDPLNKFLWNLFNPDEEEIHPNFL